MHYRISTYNHQPPSLPPSSVGVFVLVAAARARGVCMEGVGPHYVTTYLVPAVNGKNQMREREKLKKEKVF